MSRVADGRALERRAPEAPGDARTSALLRELARRYARVRQSAASDFGMSVVQCDLLGELGRDGPLSIRSLTVRLGFGDSWVRRAATWARRAGWVAQRPRSLGEAGTLLQLTAAGRNTLGRLERRLDAEVAQMLAGLPTRERRALQRALLAVNDPPRAATRRAGSR